MQLAGRCVAAKIVGKGIAVLAQRVKFAASFGNQLALAVFFLVGHLQSLFEAGLDEFIQATVQNSLSVTGFDAGTQILNATLIEHVVSNLTTPSDICLTFFNN